MNSALVLIDAQVNMFEPEPVFRGNEMLDRLVELVSRARAAGTPVIFVRNNGGPDDPDRSGSPGWEIHPRLKPAPGDAIVDKHTPDSFFRTELSGALAARGVNRLIFAGMQTEYCIDTTCRRAFSLDYSVILAADAHSTFDGVIPAEQIIAHHNRVLGAFADVVPAAAISFDSSPLPDFELDAITSADRGAIRSGLDEWPEYERWLSTGAGRPFWPHTHPARFADALKAMWDPSFSPRGHYMEPPRWEIGLARTFLRPLQNIPPAFRKANLQAVKGAVDHLLQNPRNPLSTQIRPLDGQLWLYDSRDLRLFYVPHVTRDPKVHERHYIFLVWSAPGIPVHNPFA